MMEQYISEPLRAKAQKRPVLLYVLGWGRSGSSIVGNILGSIDGAASLGEVRYLWDRGIAEDGICGCGEPFSTCAFWPDMQVDGVRLGAIPKDAAMALSDGIGSGNRFHQLFAFYVGSLRRHYNRRNIEQVRFLISLYEEAFKRTGANILIDTSKSPFYARQVFDHAKTFDIIFLHLVRDPRAVLYSWNKIKQREDSKDAKEFPRYSALRSCVQWYVFNAASQRFGALAPAAYRFMKYEDFASDWRSETARALPDLVDYDRDVIADANMAQVSAQHSISGNPSRFVLGNIRVRVDQNWSSTSKGVGGWLVDLMLPFMAKAFGYTL